MLSSSISCRAYYTKSCPLIRSESWTAQERKGKRFGTFLVSNVFAPSMSTFEFVPYVTAKPPRIVYFSDVSARGKQQWPLQFVSAPPSRQKLSAKIISVTTVTPSELGTRSEFPRADLQGSKFSRPTKGVLPCARRAKSSRN